jgi:YidC/Oxa1 family membrane protein insertase
LATAYAFVPNFGIAIIFLTFVINTLLFPLTLKQTRSSRAMMSIQPELQRIRREYRDQREEMQRRMTELQREHGASPLGCVGPLLVQSPILFAIFRVLNDPTGQVNDLSPVPRGSALWEAIEAQEATFVGMDLGVAPSAAIDGGILGAVPYLLTMILMIAAQYVQQWYTQRDQVSAPGGERQKRQMQMFTRIMPLFLGFISWNFPAGLLLYWTTSTLVRLGQQVAINWMDGRPEPPAGLTKEDKPDPGGPPSPSPPHPRSAKKSRRRKRRK